MGTVCTALATLMENKIFKKGITNIELEF